jgi:hypothetical protein
MSESLRVSQRFMELLSFIVALSSCASDHRTEDRPQNPKSKQIEDQHNNIMNDSITMSEYRVMSVPRPTSIFDYSLYT